MLYLENPTGTFTPWHGEPLGGIVYPLSIESIWSEQELADVGLYAPVDPGVPDGKIVTGFTVKRVGGVVTKVYDLEDAPPPTGDQVDTERERRIALPLKVTLSVGTITINMDSNAQRNIQGLANVGQYLVTTGSSQTTAFRDYDNASHDLTPADLVAMGLQVAQRIQTVYTKSWIIKSMDPIPDNYVDDVWW